VGECFFWYLPTRVVPDQRPLNGCVVCVSVCVRATSSVTLTETMCLSALRGGALSPGSPHGKGHFLGEGVNTWTTEACGSRHSQRYSQQQQWRVASGHQCCSNLQFLCLTLCMRHLSIAVVQSNDTAEITRSGNTQKL